MRLARGALIVAALLVGFAVLGNAGTMREGAGFLRDESTGAQRRARRAAARGASASTPDFQPDPESGAADPRRRLPRGNAPARLERTLAEGDPGPLRARPRPRRPVAAPRARPAVRARRHHGRRRARGRGLQGRVGDAAGRLPGADRAPAAPRPPTSSSRAGASSCARAPPRSASPCGASRTPSQASRSPLRPAARGCGSSCHPTPRRCRGGHSSPSPARYEPAPSAEPRARRTRYIAR